MTDQSKYFELTGGFWVTDEFLEKLINHPKVISEYKLTKQREVREDYECNVATFRPVPNLPDSRKKIFAAIEAYHNERFDDE